MDNMEFIPSIQYGFLYLMPSSSLVLLTWTFQRCLASKVMPKHFADVAWGTWVSLFLTGKFRILLFVMLTWVDLFSFNPRMYCVYWFCSLSVASSLVSPVDKMAASSAKVATVSCSNSGMSHVHKNYRTGSNTLSCGTPALISLRLVSTSSCFTLKYLS